MHEPQKHFAKKVSYDATCKPMDFLIYFLHHAQVHGPRDCITEEVAHALALPYRKFS
jgi:hypothetical protein